MGSIKKKLNKVVNKVADKVMPKELAPFLPIISMFAPGLGIGSLLGKFGMTGLNPTMMRWVMPQITNALASGKMGGEVDWKGAAMAAAASALHGPQSQTEAEKQFLKDNKVLLDKSSDAALRQAKLDTAELITDPSAYYEQLQDMSKLEQFPMQDNTFWGGLKDTLVPDDLFGWGWTGEDIEGSMWAREPKQFYKFDDGSVFAKDTKNWLLPDNRHLNQYLENMPTPDSYKPFLDSPDATGQAFKDFFMDKEILGDTALSEKMFDKKMKNALDIAGKQPMKVAMNKAKGFFQTPPGFNSATMAKIGMGATPWISAEAKKDEEEAEQAEADWQNKIDAMTDAEQALTDYYWNMNPDYDWLYKNKNYYNTGGRVNRMGGGIMGAMPPEGTQWDGRQGGFMPLGQKPQADDVPAMLSKDEFVMTRDAVKGLGDGDANVGAQRMYDLMNSLEAKAYV